MCIYAKSFSLCKFLGVFLLVVLPAYAESNSTAAEKSGSSVSAEYIDNDISHNKKIILEGTYEFRSDQNSLEIRGKQICFFPNESSAKIIPKLPEDIRLSWFCFSNTEYAAYALNISLADSTNCGVDGLAKIVVADYEIFKEEGEGNDLAKLLEVIEISNTKPLLCEEKQMDNSNPRKELSDFEKMLKGFRECKFEKLYVEFGSTKPLHDYFIKRNLTPYKVENELAYFHVDESFMGLSVKEIIIPAGFSVVAIVFEENLVSAEKKLKNYLIYGYNQELDPMQSNPLIKWVPELISFHKNKSALSCSNSN